MELHLIYLSTHGNENCLTGLREKWQHIANDGDGEDEDERGLEDIASFDSKMASIENEIDFTALNASKIPNVATTMPFCLPSHLSINISQSSRPPHL